MPGTPLASYRVTNRISLEKGFSAMLILSRRLNERIHLPELNTTVQVVSIKSGAVRLGIDAPSEVSIRREEVPEPPTKREPARPRPFPPGSELTAEARRQSLTDWLKHTSMKLGMARLQLNAGRAEEGHAALEAIHEELQFLRERLGGEVPAEAPAPAGPKEHGMRANQIRRLLMAACSG
jgi:carbon storage regulator CsrA